MSFVDAVRSGLQRYADFSGRSRRSEYWWFAVFTALVSLLFIVLFGGIAVSSDTPAVFALAYVPSIALLLPQLAVSIRRLHDTGRPGLWFLLNLVPFGGLVLLVFYASDSTPEDNAWGPSPKRGGAHGVATAASA